MKCFWSGEAKGNLYGEGGLVVMFLFLMYIKKEKEKERKKLCNNTGFLNWYHCSLRVSTNKASKVPADSYTTILS